MALERVMLSETLIFGWSTGVCTVAVVGRILVASLLFRIIRALYHILETFVLVAANPRHAGRL